MAWEWFSVKQVDDGTFGKFRISLCHTTRTTLAESYEENYAGFTPVRVFYRDPLPFNPPLGDWFGFQFDTPFHYDGVHNLICEVWWEGATDDATAYTDWGPFTGRCVVSFVVNGQPECGYPNRGRVQDYLHYMRVTMSGVGVQPTSLGRVKALYR